MATTGRAACTPTTITSQVRFGGFSAPPATPHCIHSSATPHGRTEPSSTSISTDLRLDELVCPRCVLTRRQGFRKQIRRDLVADLGADLVGDTEAPPEGLADGVAGDAFVVAAGHQIKLGGHDAVGEISHPTPTGAAPRNMTPGVGTPATRPLRAGL